MVDAIFAPTSVLDEYDPYCYLKVIEDLRTENNKLKKEIGKLKPKE